MLLGKRLEQRLSAMSEGERAEYARWSFMWSFRLSLLSAALSLVALGLSLLAKLGGG